MAAVITDIRVYRIPNVVIKISIIVWIIIMSVITFIDTSKGIILIKEGIAGFISSGIIMLIAYQLVHRRLGAGDVKLSAILGLYLSFDAALKIIFIAMILSAATYPVIRKVYNDTDNDIDGTCTHRTKIPLAPFFLIGTLIYSICASAHP
ncbi:MAG: prepilin peptidase [Butyrivibrio sp.]|nr:prepilin peptidase [Butyrivibrio sp.]